MKLKKILYGIQGEGRGHATRSLPIINALEKKGHKLLILASNDALPILRENTASEIIEIPSLSYSYANLQLSYLKTLLSNTIPLLQLFFYRGRSYKYIENIIEDYNPDLVISDYEQYSARIAHKKSIYLISLDHSGILSEAQLPKLNNNGLKKAVLRLHELIRSTLTKPDVVITSSFCNFEKKKNSNSLFVGHIIRQAIRNAHTEEQDHITVYLKRPIYIKKLLKALANIENLQFHIFSSFSDKELQAYKNKNITLSKINEKLFIESLASAKAVFCTAGNQTLGESIYLSKPVLAFPEPRVIEQEINAIALTNKSWGMYADINKLSKNTLVQFVQNIDLYKKNITKFLVTHKDYDSTQKVIDFILK